MDEQAPGRASGDRPEFLVILSGEQAADALDRVRSTYRVTQMASPRVVVVESGPDEAARLQSIPGVKMVTAGELPPGSIEGLDDSEVLFVEAWVNRITELPSKRRRGEGLPWDAPGFIPPDRPPGVPDSGEAGEQERRGQDGR
jgi:hypothetical protein